MLELLHERFCERTVNTVPTISKLVCIECCLHFVHLFPMHVRRSWIKPWGAVNQTGQWCLLSHCCVRFNSPANVRRIGGGDDAACLLGAGVLPAATRLRQGPSGRRTGSGVQMDPYSLSVLAGAHAVRCVRLSPGASSPWLIADPKSCEGIVKNRKKTLTVPLRTCVRLRRRERTLRKPWVSSPCLYKPSARRNR